jgi:coenzyme PQQ synthesis protein D (PqqD)
MCPTIGKNQTIETSANAVWCDVAGEVVLLELSSGVYFGLKGVGWALWHYLQAPRTLEAILEYLTSRYAVERAVCEEQTTAFLEKLAEHGLIQVREP